MMGGIGEIGSDPNLTAVNGPHYWLAHGWDGSVVLGNGVHYPIIISVQSGSAWPQTQEILMVLNYILNTYHIKRNSVHLTGLSMGAMAWTAMICQQNSPGGEDGMKVVTSVAALEGQSTAVSTSATANEYPGFSSFAVWAQKYHGRFFGLEGTGDYRNVGAISDAMNAAVPGSAYFSYETIGGGTHCCWDQMYDPSVTNWTSVGQLAPNLATGANSNAMGDYHAPSSIFQWMLRQGDTSIVGTGGPTPPPAPSLVANAGPNLYVTTNSVNLTAAASSGSIASYNWSEGGGPNTCSIANATSVNTTVNGLVNGTYTFNLKLTGPQGNTALTQVSVTVNMPGAPTANAGSNQTITLPTNSVSLAGTGSSNGGSITGYSWAEISGPNTNFFSQSSSSSTSAGGLVAGVYVFQLTVTDNNGQTGTSSVSVTVNPAPVQTPTPPPTSPTTPSSPSAPAPPVLGSNGFPMIPGTVQAENYNYMSGVATENTSDDGGGQDVGWIDKGDWMAYNVNVVTAGTYTVSLRVASPNNGASLSINLTDGTLLGNANIPNTGGFQNWQTITVQVTLSAGTQTLVIGSTNYPWWNINWMQFALSSGASTPPSNGFQPIPGVIQAESYNYMSGVATEPTTDAGAGLDVGWIDNGDWMGYNVNVATAGTYTVNLRVASPYSGASLSLNKTDGTVLGSAIIPNTGGFQNWQTITMQVTLSAGNQTLVIGSTSSPEWNINWAQFVSSGDNNRSIPGTIQAENYDVSNGVATQATSDAGGGQNVGWIDNGDWMTYYLTSNASGNYLVSLRVASPYSGGSLQLQTPGGNVLLTLPVPNTGGWQNWTTITGTCYIPQGGLVLVLVSNANPGWNINWMQFNLNGIGAQSSPTTSTGMASSLQTFGGESLLIAPNPVHDKFTLHLENSHTGAMQVQVIDVNGKVLRNYRTQKDQQSSQLDISVGDLQRGSYFIRVQIGDWIVTKQMLKL
jgi:hypothetical protein